MKKENDRARIIRELIHTTDREFTDEELIHQLTATKITRRAEPDKPTLGQRASDAVARFAGSWAFIFSFIGVMVGWMVVNVALSARAFDAYPFILLNLVLSCIAAIQAPHRTNRKKLKHFYAGLSVCSSFVLPDFMPEECHVAVDFS